MYWNWNDQKKLNIWTPEIWPSLLTDLWRFFRMQWHSQTHIITFLIPKRDCHSKFCWGINWFLKNWALWNSFSLFLVKFSVLNLFLCLFVCSFSFWIITFIQADTEKGPFSSNCSFSVSSCMCEMILGNWTSTKNRFNTENFTGKRESSFIWLVQANCEKLISITNYEYNIKWLKNVLMTMDVLKNQIFTMFMMFPQTSFTICTFCMVTTLAQNQMLELFPRISKLTKQYIWKHQKSDHFYWITCTEVFKVQTLAMVLATVQGCIPATVQSSYFLEGNWIASFKNWTLWTFHTLFPVKCSVLNWCLLLVWMQFPIKNQYIHTSR